MKKLIITGILIFFFVGNVYAREWKVNLQCDNSIIDILINEFEEGIKIWDVELSIRSKFNSKKISILKYEQVYFKYSCEKTKNKKDYFIFQAYCTGSGCNDLDNWGIINNYGKIVLVPYKNNRHWKKKILSEN